MTDTNTKIRSLVLAALMVFSVFAGTVALSGAAAADATAFTAGSATNVEIGQDSVTQNVTFNVTASNDDMGDNVTIDISAASDAGVTVNSVSASSSNGNLTATAVQNGTDIVVNVSDTANDGTNASSTVTVTLDHNTTGVSSTASGVSFPITVRDGGQSGSVSFDLVDTASADDADVDLTTNNGSLVFQGQTVYGSGFGADKTLTLRRVTDSGTSFVRQISADADGEVVASTSGLSAGDYRLVNGDNRLDFEVAIQSFSVSADDGAVNDGGSNNMETFAVSSNRGGTFDVEVSATLDGEAASNTTLQNIFEDATSVDSETVEVTVSDGSSFDGNFTGAPAGTHNFTFDVADTTASVEESVTVTEIGVGGVTFADNAYSVSKGGNAEITLNLTGGATDGTLVVGQEENSGYQANITFTDSNDDGEVTIRFNTYAAGNPEASIVEAAGEDDASVQDGSTDLGDNLLDEGGYDLAVSATADQDGDAVFNSGESDFSALSIGPRSTDSMQLWTAPGAASASDVFDSTLTQDTTIAKNDWVIHQVSATGLGGLVDAKGDFSAALGNGLNVSVMQTEASTRSNRQPKKLNLTASPSDAVQLWADSDNDTYYIAIDTEEAMFDRGSMQRTVAADEEYTATFTVDDSKLVGEDTESVNATFEIVERTASLNSTPVTAQAASGQQIMGSASFAPGTTFTVTVKSAGDTSPRFYKNPTATVQADGTWNVTVDFSEQSVGDTFSVRALNGMISADGEIGENATATPATATATATATPESTTDTATATATATPETDMTTDTATDEPDTDTETGTSEDIPGFGVAVALIALLAAALLAGRRE